MSIYWKSRLLAIITVSLIIGAQLTAAKTFAAHGGQASVKAGPSKSLSR